jgi:hypothetical protein
MIAPGMLSCITAMPAGSAFCSVDGTAWILSNGFFRVYWKFGRLAFGALSGARLFVRLAAAAACCDLRLRMTLCGGGTKY